MSEPTFFRAAQSLSAAEIAELAGASLRDGDDGERRIDSIAALDLAGPRDIAFVGSAKYAGHLAFLRAGICLVTARFAAQVPARTVALIAADPYRAFVAVAQRLFPEAMRPSFGVASEDVPAGAYVHTTARLEPEVHVEPGAVVGPDAEIGTGTVIAPGVVIGPSVRIGRYCAIGAGASITHAMIGDHVTVHAGCRIGQDGFGYIPSPAGHAKVPQVGRVIIQDRVEIGANTTIDRGGARDTVIGEGTKIDNLVQIGHNVSIGRHCLIVGQCGLSGSVTLEDYVVLGGQVGIADHLTVGEGAQVGAKSGVMHNIPAGERWLGAPAMPARDFMRQVARLQAGASRPGRPAERQGKPDEGDGSQ